jgi:hypothetical protein
MNESRLTVGNVIRRCIFIDYLRNAGASPDGSSITILNPNDDGPPNEAVEVVGPWTAWIPRRFEGAALLDVLRDAAQHRAEITREPVPDLEASIKHVVDLTFAEHAGLSDGQEMQMVLLVARQAEIIKAYRDDERRRLHVEKKKGLLRGIPRTGDRAEIVLMENLWLARPETGTIVGGGFLELRVDEDRDCEFMGTFRDSEGEEYEVDCDLAYLDEIAALAAATASYNVLKNIDPVAPPAQA